MKHDLYYIVLSTGDSGKINNIIRKLVQRLNCIL